MDYTVSSVTIVNPHKRGTKLLYTFTAQQKKNHINCLKETSAVLNMLWSGGLNCVQQLDHWKTLWCVYESEAFDHLSGRSVLGFCDRILCVFRTQQHYKDTHEMKAERWKAFAVLNMQTSKRHICAIVKASECEI